MAEAFGFTPDEAEAIAQREATAKAERTSPENIKRVYRLMGPRDMWGRLIEPDKVRKKQSNPEGQIQAACMAWLAWHKVFHFRVNNVPAPLPNGGFRPVHTRGVADCLAVINGAFIGIEFKSLVGRQSDDQKTFEANVKKAGGKYYVIRSVDELEAVIKPLLNTP